MSVKSKQLVRRAREEIRTFASSHANPALVAKYSRYFRDGYPGWGLTREQSFEMRESVIRKFRGSLGFNGFLELGELILGDGKYEEIGARYLCLLEFRSEFDRTTFDRLGRWIELGIRNWAHTDVLCGEVLSVFLQNGITKPEDFAGWTRSECSWKRRAVPVSLLTSLKSGVAPKKLFRLIQPLMEDPAREVQQGVGWFLRESWKQHRDVTEAFLLKWKDRSPRLIYQYATERMSASERERFRRAKK